MVKENKNTKIKEVNDKLKEVKKVAKEETQQLRDKNNELLELLLTTLARQEKNQTQMILSIISLSTNLICWAFCFFLIAKGI